MNTTNHTAAPLQVAVAVIYYQNRYLLARRRAEKHEGGKLEFVGGKLEASETPKEALLREVLEELGADIAGCETVFLGKFLHEMGAKKPPILLWVYCVALDSDSYQTLHAALVGKENQPLYWYDKEDLPKLIDRLPKANAAIIKQLLANNGGDKTQ